MPPISPKIQHLSYMKTSTIEITVNLDENNIPKRIEWKSDDDPSHGEASEVNGFMLSLFDTKTLETLKIDLWTNKMEVGEMNRLTYNTIKGLADTYFKATKNTNLANDIARFAQYFGEESGILKK